MNCGIITTFLSIVKSSILSLIMFYFMPFTRLIFSSKMLIFGFLNGLVFFAKNRIINYNQLPIVGTLFQLLDKLILSTISKCITNI
jgi:hypothetical protein